eukprot:TRINITY_DN55454_c0_g1_i1.p1 TRINITY_DN55454_c0_g1~~TRINITY_DN55454_c0_g1_i1.p1  ORF type:complete len:574 (-),score=66.01 TRINITY_DN55454_c0_g1_i1:8-1729(-)
MPHMSMVAERYPDSETTMRSIEVGRGASRRDHWRLRDLESSFPFLSLLSVFISVYAVSPATADGPLGVSGFGRIGIVTMHTPDIASYSNWTAAHNQLYASRWGYGFHIFDHAIDRDRVPHWSKLHVVQLFLAEYDFVLWIDADAVFFDQSRSIEEVMRIAEHPTAEMWAQDIWPDYPSIHRNERIDTGIVLFRNTRWTRQFLLELYHYPDCQEHLNWTEQYCFTVAYNSDLLGMRDRFAILPTPTINHHVLPPPNNPNALFILHLAGRKSKAREAQFSQVHNDRQAVFQEKASSTYASFWHFRELFSRHSFGGIASLQACIFGMGTRHRHFMDALLFHFPYIASFTVVRQGAPGLWTAMRSTESIGERYPDRLAHLDITEYILGKTRDGDRFVDGFFCDVFVLGVESWRHLRNVEVLGRLARSGLEANRADANTGLGFSPVKDAYFAFLYDGCDGGWGVASAAAGETLPLAAEGSRLDADDENGDASSAACDFLRVSRTFLGSAINASADTSVTASAEEKQAAEPELTPTLWGIRAPGTVGFQAFGDVALARVPRDAFPEQEAVSLSTGPIKV